MELVKIYTKPWNLLILTLSHGTSTCKKYRNQQFLYDNLTFSPWIQYIVNQLKTMQIFSLNDRLALKCLSATLSQLSISMWDSDLISDRSLVWSYYFICYNHFLFYQIHRCVNPSGTAYTCIYSG